MTAPQGRPGDVGSPPPGCLWRSPTGWALLTAYLIPAGLLFYRALTCTGWVCDLVALPVAIPLGLPIAWLTDWIHAQVEIPGHIKSFHFRNTYFILPTVAANAILYYWVGRQIERLIRRWRGRSRPTGQRVPSPPTHSTRR